RAAAGERGVRAGEEPDRAQVDVLAEAAADRDQEAPERDVVGHARKSDGAEVDRVEAPKLVESVRRHHAAGRRVGLAAPVEGGPVELEVEAAGGGVEDPSSLRHDLPADPVAGNDRD